MAKFIHQNAQWVVLFCNLKPGNQDLLNDMINHGKLDKKHIDKLESLKCADKYLDEGNSEEDNLDFLPYRW